MPKGVGEKIREARTEAALSRDELARLAFLSSDSIASYELGRRRPRLDSLGAIARATGRAPGWFLEEAA